MASLQPFCTLTEVNNKTNLSVVLKRSREPITFVCTGYSLF